MSVVQQTDLKLLRMIAAAWGCVYEADRDFTATWEKNQDGTLGLKDVADGGFFSYEAEGLLARYAMWSYQALPPAKFQHHRGYHWYFNRSEWSASMATAEDWEALRKGLHSQFANKGSGVNGPALREAHMAIDMLKAGAKVTAGACRA
ncbi:hypothetical protein HNP46_005781 [Pseudomonas nitritireducens]|uniref:Uncharacterized protein n=1 Tax=Pseudomonas nitroreducens TaxID=46680 RepID=A0A7W7KQT9_PSENT|nr:hypothetical protein [Pseudomonas nitritireducens]MBB4866874.1 hypothetical protein [Pseudomonas nitritireducens]